VRRRRWLGSFSRAVNGAVRCVVIAPGWSSREPAHDLPRHAGGTAAADPGCGGGAASAFGNDGERRLACRSVVCGGGCGSPLGSRTGEDHPNHRTLLQWISGWGGTPHESRSASFGIRAGSTHRMKQSREPSSVLREQARARPRAAVRFCWGGLFQSDKRHNTLLGI
jgi:hypothetical protein